jgi:hypothetical protein
VLESGVNTSGVRVGLAQERLNEACDDLGDLAILQEHPGTSPSPTGRSASSSRTETSVENPVLIFFTGIPQFLEEQPGHLLRGVEVHMGVNHGVNAGGYLGSADVQLPAKFVRRSRSTRTP